MIKLPDNLAFRLTLRYALAFISLIIAGFLILYFGISSVLSQQMDEDLEEDIIELRALYNRKGLDALRSEIDREVKPGEESRLFIRLLDSTGKTIYSSDLTHWNPLVVNFDVLKDVIDTKVSDLSTSIFENQEHDTRIIYGFIAPNIVIQIGESFEEKYDLLEIIRQVLLAILLLAIPVASLISWLMARQAAKGIEAVSKIAEEIDRGKLDSRVNEIFKEREIRTLASTFNLMLERINILIAEMRDITDNIAHDLRSPLARIRAISEVGVSNNRTLEEHRTASADIIEECDRLLQMVNTTLDVAEAEAGISHNPVEEVNVSELVNDACELFQAVAEEKYIDLTCSIKSDCKIQGNISNLQRMLANLLDNALKYTHENGSVNLELFCDKKQVKISVADTGIGIPEHDVTKIFDRFFRCDQSRSQDGCGMGLSFSRAVARSHGGDITVKSTPGLGSVFTIEIPA